MAHRHAGSDRDIVTALALSGATAIDGASPPLACLLELNPLLRLLAHEAVAELGFAVADLPSHQASSSVAVFFVGLDSLQHCPRCGVIRSVVASCGGEGVRSGQSPPFTIGYVSGPLVMLAAHGLHHCSDLVVHLQAQDGRAVFMYPDAALGAQPVGQRGVSPLLPPDLTPREADILLLLLDGCSTAAIAARLWLSTSTVRSHCRSVLRKCGAQDRRTLRRQLLEQGAGAAMSGVPVTGWTRPSRPSRASDEPRERPGA